MIKPLSTFYTLLLDVALIIGTVGYVAPYLISQPNTPFVAGGVFLVAVILPTLLYYINRGLVAKITNMIKESN